MAEKRRKERGRRDGIRRDLVKAFSQTTEGSRAIGSFIIKGRKGGKSHTVVNRKRLRKKRKKIEFCRLVFVGTTERRRLRLSRLEKNYLSIPRGKRGERSVERRG